MEYKCQFAGGRCRRTASYGRLDTKERTHCYVHKTAEEVILCQKKCIAKGCNTTATFGSFKGRDRIHCVRHRQPLETNNSYGHCMVSACTNRAKFGSADRSGIRCYWHKLKSDVSILRRKGQAKVCITANFAASILVSMAAADHLN